MHLQVSWVQSPLGRCQLPLFQSRRGQVMQRILAHQATSRTSAPHPPDEGAWGVIFGCPLVIAFMGLFSHGSIEPLGDLVRPTGRRLTSKGLRVIRTVLAMAGERLVESHSPEPHLIN